MRYYPSASQQPTLDRLWVRIGLLGLLLAAYALRLHELARQDIWWDEARNIDVALRPFLQVATAPELDIHPPVYFWALHVWLRLAGVERGMEPMQIAFMARFLSVAAGVAGVGLLAAFASGAANRRAGVMAAVVGAFSPFWLAESQEARMYTLDFALLMGAALALYRCAETDGAGEVGIAEALRARRAALAAFAGLSALGLLTHYNAVFIVAAWFLWWGALGLARRGQARRAELGVAVAAGLPITVLALPVAPIALRQIPGYANPNLGIPSVTEYLWQNWQAYLGGYAFSVEMLAGFGTVWLWAAAAMAAAGIAAYRVSYWGATGGAQRARMWLLVFWTAGGLVLYYIAVLDRGAFNVRYSSFVTPALYALLGVALSGWGRRPAIPAALGLALILAGFVPGIRADLYDERFAREDITGVTSWLRDHAGANDVVFVDQKYPFGFYYERYAIDPGDQPIGDEPVPARYLFVDINTIDKRLDEWAGDAGNVFWVQWYESDTDPRRAVAFLLDKAGERSGEEWFRGYSIDSWRMGPPTQFELAPNMNAALHAWPPAVETVEASLPDTVIEAGEQAPIVIRWRRTAGGYVDRPLKARVAIYDEDGARVAQSDQRLLNDRHLLPAEWGQDDQPLNVYLLALPEDMPPGIAEIRALVYDADTLEALTLVDQAGNPAGQEAVLGSVRVVQED